MNRAAREIIRAYGELVETLDGEELLEISHRIFRSRQAGAVLLYLCHARATQRQIVEELGVPEASVSRVLKNLRRLGIVEVKELLERPRPTQGRRRRRKSGPREALWGLVRPS